MPRKNSNYRNNKPLCSTIQKIQMAITHQKEDPLFELTQRILTYLENYRPYIDTDFSLDSLTTVMQVPQRHISYCINTIMNTSFYHLRAALRVEYAIQLLDGDIKKKLTIEAIGEKAGFKTRSNLYNAFKEITGKTPKEYHSEINNLKSVLFFATKALRHEVICYQFLVQSLRFKRFFKFLITALLNHKSLINILQAAINLMQSFNRDEIIIITRSYHQHNSISPTISGVNYCIINGVPSTSKIPIYC